MAFNRGRFETFYLDSMSQLEGLNTAYRIPECLDMAVKLSELCNEVTRLGEDFTRNEVRELEIIASCNRLERFAGNPEKNPGAYTGPADFIRRLNRTLLGYTGTWHDQAGFPTGPTTADDLNYQQLAAAGTPRGPPAPKGKAKAAPKRGARQPQLNPERYLEDKLPKAADASRVLAENFSPDMVFDDGTSPALSAWESFVFAFLGQGYLNPPGRNKMVGLVKEFADGVGKPLADDVKQNHGGTVADLEAIGHILEKHKQPIFDEISRLIGRTSVPLGAKVRILVAALKPLDGLRLDGAENIVKIVESLSHLEV